jgi:hypothetical protein
MKEAQTVHGDATPPANGRLDHLEQRIHRLEDAVAAFQDTRHLEERLVERVADRMARNPPAARENANLIIEGRRSMVPALGWNRSGAEAAPQAIPVSTTDAKAPWFPWDVVSEARAMVRMFVDPRFRMTRWVRLSALGLLAIILTSWIWLLLLPGMALLPGFVSALFVKAVDLVLAFVLYKILGREARRYRAAFPGRGS